MESAGERFEIESAIEQYPLSDPAAQRVLRRWLEVNDHIKIKYVDRKEWETASDNGMMKQGLWGNEILCLPQDIRLWELMRVIPVIDQSTFRDHPERAKEKRDETAVLGR